MDVILIAGLWLKTRVWGNVVRELEELGHRPIPVVLPGTDDGDASATLDDQCSAVLEAVDAADNPIVVGHSAAATLAWLAADRRPDAISRVIMVGGFPASSESPYAKFFPIVDGVMPFPGWEPFEGADAADLNADLRKRLAGGAVAVPGSVATAIVSYESPERFAVPVTLVCPEFSPEDAVAWISAGELPELSLVEDITFADIDSGHWPMATKPRELAELLVNS